MVAANQAHPDLPVAQRVRVCEVLFRYFAPLAVGVTTTLALAPQSLLCPPLQRQTSYPPLWPVWSPLCHFTRVRGNYMRPWSAWVSDTRSLSGPWTSPLPILNASISSPS